MNPQLIAAGFAAATLLAGTVLASFIMRRQPSDSGRLERRIAQVSGATIQIDEEAPSEQSGKIFQPRRAQGHLHKWMNQRFLLTGGAKLLFRAIVIFAMAGIVATVTSLMLFRIGAWSFLSGPAIGLALTWFFLSTTERSKRQAFSKTFPEVVDQVVRLSRAGMPAVEAIATVSEDAPEPVGPVLSEMASRLSSGLDPDVVVREIADRLKIPEFTLFTAAISLQRSAGGGITRPLTNLSMTLRERREIALKAQGATAQTRASLWVLGAVPVVVTAMQWMINPGTTDFLFGTEEGAALIRWGVGLILAGLGIARALTARAGRCPPRRSVWWALCPLSR